MNENRSPEPAQDRRVTWALMGAVILFVVLMSAIVLWITTSLIRNEIGSSDATTPSRPTAAGTAALPAAPGEDAAEVVEETAVIESVWTPVPVVATFTPRPKSRGYVRWLYWYVRPNSVKLGECVQVTWETENAASLQLFRNEELILDNAPPAQTFEDCPTQAGYIVYRMVGVNSEGESNWIQLQVRVRAP